MDEIVDWGVASRALAGEPVSGDLHLVATFDQGALAAVIDGLGHGPEAAEAARAAAAVLSRRSDASVSDLIQLCHQELRQTRGVAMSLASFNARSNVMTWVGVGDVEGVLAPAVGAAERSPQWILLRSGIVGYRLPPLRETALPVAPGDTLIFATDGVHPGFDSDDGTRRSPQEIADDILARLGKFTDDALALVVRYWGATS